VITETAQSAAALQHAYAARLDLARNAAGVIGVIGNTVPRELILACGRVPILIAAAPGLSTPNADLYMEDIIPPETKFLFEAAITGTYAFLDLLILSRPYAHLYYYLKEVFRLGRAPLFPELHMFDLMQSQRAAVRTYNWGRTEALIERLERLSGEEITETRLRDAIAVTDRNRGLQRSLLERRWQADVSGMEAMQALGAGYFMAPQDYFLTLKSYLDDLQRDPDLGGRPRLLIVTSEPLGHTRLHAALESAGALVVAEDDWWGSRAPGADVPVAGSAREAILQKYWLDTASPGMYPADARESWLREHALRPELDGVVFYLPPSDHQLGWDYPRLKGWLDDHQKPSLLLRSDATQADGFASIRAAAEAFVRSIS
jgi:benzoyl-CoA reductase/2-hydroxyglutaryl-CoA dehydratase subunit BcrC/BadD/HgdB